MEKMGGKPSGVAADNGVGVVLVHRGSTGNAENDNHVDLVEDDGNEDNSGATI